MKQYVNFTEKDHLQTFETRFGRKITFYGKVARNIASHLDKKFHGQKHFKLLAK